jgi:hypothetical protein
MNALIVLAQALSRLRQWLTVRRVLHILAITAIFLLAGQLAAVTDVAFLASLDWGLALEVFAAMMILAARAHTTATLRFLRHKLRRAKRRWSNFMRRGAARAGRRPGPQQTPPATSADEDGAAAGIGLWNPRPALLFGAVSFQPVL